MTSGRRGQNVEAQGRQEPARSRAVPRPCRCRLGPLLTSPGGERLRWVWGAPGGRAETMSPSGPTPSGFRGLVGRRTNGRRARATTGCGGHWQPLRLRALAPAPSAGLPALRIPGPQAPPFSTPIDPAVPPGGWRCPGDARPRRRLAPAPQPPRPPEPWCERAALPGGDSGAGRRRPDGLCLHLAPLPSRGPRGG